MAGFELTTPVAIGTDWKRNCNSNYHTIMTMTTSSLIIINIKYFNVNLIHHMSRSVFKLFVISRLQFYFSVFNVFRGSRYQMYISIFNVFKGSRHQMSGQQYTKITTRSATHIFPTDINLNRKYECKHSTATNLGINWKTI